MSKFLEEIVLSEQEAPAPPASGTLSLFGREGGLYYLNDQGELVGPLGSGGGIPTGPTPPANPSVDDLWVDTSADVTPNAFTTTFEGGF